MSVSSATPTATAPASTARGRAAGFTTASVISFSMTMLAGSVAVLAGLVPLHHLSTVERVDIGSLLFAVPILALVLAVVVEASRVALRRRDLPAPRRRAPVRWTPGHREG